MRIKKNHSSFRRIERNWPNRGPFLQYRRLQSTQSKRVSRQDNGWFLKTRSLSQCGWFTVASLLDSSFFNNSSCHLPRFAALNIISACHFSLPCIHYVTLLWLVWRRVRSCSKTKKKRKTYRGGCFCTGKKHLSPHMQNPSLISSGKHNFELRERVKRARPHEIRHGDNIALCRSVFFFFFFLIRQIQNHLYCKSSSL